MKILSILFLPIFITLSLNAAAEPGSVIDCNKIFEERKGELLVEIEKIDEQQQALQALQAATQTMLDKRETAIGKREQDINTTLQQISQKEQEIKKILQENEDLLAAIKEAKDDKIAETYSKMKASKAAPILEAMNRGEAAEILFSLNPKIMGAMLGKMAPANASELTELLKKGPPFTKQDGIEVSQTPGQ